MQLTKIEVIGLFKTFNHSISFKNSERITILIGQNGVGKTLLLRMIKSFYDLDFIELKSIEFEKFILSFENKDIVEIKREKKKIQKEEELLIENDDRSDVFELVINYKRYKSDELTYVPNNFETPRLQAIRSARIIQRGFFEPEFSFDSEIDILIGRFLPERFRKLESGIWVDRINRRRFSTYELIDRYKSHFPPDILDKIRIPNWLKEITSEVKARIIETQRLLDYQMIE
jgi:predicted ATP-dependent endonuclease of OLD family